MKKYWLVEKEYLSYYTAEGGETYEEALITIEEMAKDDITDDVVVIYGEIVPFTPPVRPKLVKMENKHDR